MIKSRPPVRAAAGRPGGVTALAIAMALVGILTAFIGARTGMLLDQPIVQALGPDIFMALMLFVGLVELITAVGLWRMTYWGYAPALVLICTLGIGWGLVRMASGFPDYLILVAFAGALVYWLIGLRHRFHN